MKYEFCFSEALHHTLGAFLRGRKCQQICGIAVLVLAAEIAHADSSGLRCEKVRKHDWTERIITYVAPDGKIYALNGYARMRARSRGWLIASRELPPEQVSSLLQQGLDLCKRETEGAAPAS